MQIGHFSKDIAHLRQHKKWPHGLKVAFLSRSWQILHKVNSSALLISSSIYESISASLSSSNFFRNNSIILLFSCDVRFVQVLFSSASMMLFVGDASLIERESFSAFKSFMVLEHLFRNPHRGYQVACSSHGLSSASQLCIMPSQ